jgi:hypothetical protein
MVGLQAQLLSHSPFSTLFHLNGQLIMAGVHGEAKLLTSCPENKKSKKGPRVPPSRAHPQMT